MGWALSGASANCSPPLTRALQFPAKQSPRSGGELQQGHAADAQVVLLTGARGFIGRHVLRSLRRRGHLVVGVTRGVPPPDGGGVRWLQSDLLRRGSPAEVVRAAQAHMLMHLAWQVPEGGTWDSPVHALWGEATVELLNAFAEHGTRAVCAGTCAEYEWGDDVLREGLTPLAPRTPYGAAKVAAGQRAVELADAYHVSLAWGRVFYTFGPGEAPSRLVPSVVRAVLDGRPVPITAGRQRRDFLYVEDLASAFVALLDSEVEGPVNLAAGQAMAVRDLALAAAACAGGPQLLRVGALPGRPDEPHTIIASVDRLGQEVGWHPSVGVEEGIRRTVDWWRERTNISQVPGA